MKTRRRKKKKEEKEDRERERGWKGRLLVTYQPSVRPVGPLLLHRKLEGRPLPREQSHEEEEGEAKRGHEVDTRRGRHGGRLVSLRLQSAAHKSQSLSFSFSLSSRRFLFHSFLDSFFCGNFENCKINCWDSKRGHRGRGKEVLEVKVLSFTQKNKISDPIFVNFWHASF